MSALVWPLLCIACRLTGPERVIPDAVMFWASLSYAVAAVGALCILIVVVIPEATVEIVRLSCMESIVAVKS